MQSLAWYARRLQAMTALEVAWRARSALRDKLDRWLVPARTRLQSLDRILVGGTERTGTRGFHLDDVEPGPLSGMASEAMEWRAHLLSRAEEITVHRLGFFDLTSCFVGDPIDWNRDHKNGIVAPRQFAPTVDYRDFRVTGDCKFVWELNRHHHLVVLAQAYRISGEMRFATEVVRQLESWLDQCPYGTGMNWRSPLELGIRLINWVVALELLHGSGIFAGPFQHRVLDSVFRHVWEIARKYSYGSSANNHLIGEAAGVYVATSYFPGLRNADRWRRESRDILCREIVAQTHADGGTCEQALGYQLFVLELFLVAGLVGCRSGDDFPPAYWSRLEQMLAFVAALYEGGSALPMFGDCDDGYVLDTGYDRGDPRRLAAVAAALGGGSDARLPGETWARPLHQLAGLVEEESGTIESRAFSQTGYYLLQSGHREAEDRISVVFDCGELGYGAIAAHGHADALGFTLRAFGVDVLVDPGTYDYFSYPEWRTYFRGTRAHNTIEVDGRDQSETQGLFLWGTRARARCVAWQPTPVGGRVSGEHDGYARLDAPVRHRRTLELDGGARRLTVLDELRGRGRHAAALCFHFAETCRIVAEEPGRYELDVGPGRAAIEFDPQLTVEILTGSEDPIGGWVSRGYHHRAPSTTFVARCRFNGEIDLSTRIEIGAPMPVDQREKCASAARVGAVVTRST